MAGENLNRELGAIQATLNAVKEDVQRLDVKLDEVLHAIPSHEEQLKSHAAQLASFRAWRNGLFGKAVALLGAAGALGAGISWFFARTN